MTHWILFALLFVGFLFMIDLLVKLFRLLHHHGWAAVLIGFAAVVSLYMITTVLLSAFDQLF